MPHHVRRQGRHLHGHQAMTQIGVVSQIGGGSAHDGKHTTQLKKLIRRAFEYQRDDVCFSFVEVLSTCPTNWGLSPDEADAWLANEMIPYYPLGIFKTPEMSAVEGARHDH